MHGKRRRRSPIKEKKESIWTSKGKTKSIAPTQPDSKVVEKFKPKKGSTAEKIVDIITPGSAGEALGMVGGTGAVGYMKKIGSKLYQTAKSIKIIKSGT